MEQYRRGDIVTVAGGVYAKKPRPALVLQDDAFDSTTSITVAPFTSVAVEAPLLRLTVPADDSTGLDVVSYVMIDKITTVRRSNIGERLGSMDPTLMIEVERRVAAFLGFAR
ncbi:MAG TPA: type II toxin-antitoxin system PemK/MazF family toxin [Candidatus Nanopelagicales bacterium]|nr:type II toxin-antitoxin system PemK/MazF family toxin [Candidatus Nanopelagicales bacterium]